MDPVSSLSSKPPPRVTPTTPKKKALPEPVPSFFLRGSSQAVLHCAHRATTASSWGLCEQEGRPGCSLLPILLRPRAPRAKDRHGRPANSSPSASTKGGPAALIHPHPVRPRPPLR